MAKITYLFGAGASFHSLPLVKAMNERMEVFKYFLEDQFERGVLKHQFAQQYIKTLDALLFEVKKRVSLDAYARELYQMGISGEHELLSLKAILSGYLIFEQLIKPDDLKLHSGAYDSYGLPPEKEQIDSDLYDQIFTSLDKRYSHFWGFFLDNKSKSPKNNLKMISWNYDMQVEFSYAKIKQCSLETTQKELQVYPSSINKVELNYPCLLKLNGSAGFFYDYRIKQYQNLFDLNEHKLINEVSKKENLELIIEILESNFKRAFNEPIMTFAWENKPVVDETRKMASKVISDTEVLVIIGYSFPDFNRDIDRAIFNDTNRIEKIYFQVPQSDFQEYSERLEGINSSLAKKVINKPNLETFYYPPVI